MEEEKELETIDGTYVDPAVEVDSTEIPEMSYEEADEYKEQEPMEDTEEEGL